MYTSVQWEYVNLTMQPIDAIAGWHGPGKVVKLPPSTKHSMNPEEDVWGKKEGGVSGQHCSTEFSTVDQMCGGMWAMMGISSMWDACWAEGALVMYRLPSGATPKYLEGALS